MRNGQNKRMRGRNNNNNNNNHRKSHNPMTRVYESNGPDVKIRGTPSHIAEKYMQLARDAHTSGDPVSAENYYQHAEHYFRLIAAAQEQFRQNNPHLARPENEIPSGARDDVFDDDDNENVGHPPVSGSPEAPFNPGDPQPFLPRDAQPFPQQQQHQPHVPRPHPQYGGAQESQVGVDRLPSFITGGQPQAGQQQQPPQQNFQGNQNNGQNGHDNQGDRFPLHRRRRRHRGGGGPRHDIPGSPQGGGLDGGDDSAHD